MEGDNGVPPVTPFALTLGGGALLAPSDPLRSVMEDLRLSTLEKAVCR